MSQKVSTKRLKNQPKQQQPDSIPKSAVTIQRRQVISPQPSFNSSKKEGKIYQKAIEDYRKLCLKTYASPNPAFVSILKTDVLNIFLASYNLKEINCLNKIIGRYQYFKELILAPHDPQKGDPNEKKKRGFGIVTPLTPAEQEKASKDMKEQVYAKNQKVYTIVQGIAKNICLSSVLTSFTLYGMILGQEHTAFLSEGLIENKSLISFTINNCQISIEAYEILLKGLLTHETIEYLDFSGNNFNDKYANMISRIIARQTQRRDLVIWSFGLRNERPLTNDYTRGLICLNLSNNQFSDIGADILTNALSYDQYIRSIDLSSNLFSKESCKKFIRMLRKNTSILSLDLKDNPGYDPEIHARMVMKMSKNIQHLNQQVINNQYSIEEFNELKQFINLSFFNVDIPEEVIEMYNSQVSLPHSHQISVNSKKNADQGKSESKSEKKSKNKKPKAEEEKYHENEEEDYDEGEEEEQYEEGEGEENDEEEVENITEGDIEKLIMSNRNLLAENVQLKKEMIEMRAGKVKNSITQNKNEGKNSNQNTGHIESNYNKIVDLLTELTDLMDNVETSMKKGGSGHNKSSEDKNKQQSVPLKNKPKEVKSKTIGEESEEHEQASNRKSNNEPQKPIQKDPKQQQQLKQYTSQPSADSKAKTKESPKLEIPSSKIAIKVEEEEESDDNEEQHHMNRKMRQEVEGDEEYEEEEDEEYLDEEDMRQNIYANPYNNPYDKQQIQQQQYMMYADEDDEDEDEEDMNNQINKKINKSF